MRLVGVADAVQTVEMNNLAAMQEPVYYGF
jgi:hypothetical protein